MKNKESYMRMAELWAANSKSRRSKVGCLIIKDNMIISDGYNGTPSGFDNDCEFLIEGKLKTKPEVLHAESNAIAKLCRSTNSSEDAILFTTLCPCFECAKLIIQCGIKCVYYIDDYRNHEGKVLLNRAKIPTHQIHVK